MVESIILSILILGAIIGGYVYFRLRRTPQKKRDENKIADKLKILEENEAESRLYGRLFASLLGRLLRP